MTTIRPALAILLLVALPASAQYRWLDAGNQVNYGDQPLSGSLAMQGTLARPRLRATLSSPRLFLGDEGIGALDARLVGTGDGPVAVDGSCRSARVDVVVSGAQTVEELEQNVASCKSFVKMTHQEISEQLARTKAGPHGVKVENYKRKPETAGYHRPHTDGEPV